MAAAVVAVPSVAGAAGVSDAAGGSPPAVLGLDLSAAYNREGRHVGPESRDGPAATAAPADDAMPPERVARPFGFAGSTFLSAGGGWAWDFGDTTDGMGWIGWSLFLADELEFRVEGAGWYFNQPGDNSGAVSVVMLIHWHPLHDECFTWSIFGEVGIGILAAFDEVPDGGTGLDFAPRVGAGYTRRIADDGTRLEVGVRWRHLSNGRIEGDARNPAVDSIQVFAGVIIPF